MPELDLTRAIRIKGAGGEIMALKGAGFSWVKPGVIDDPILAYFQATGADGAYYTPWDKSTLFQDVAGTIPVVNDGDPVGLMLDVSGNGLHAYQSISSRRPLFIGGKLYFDGVDDLLITDATTWPHIYQCSAVYQQGDKGDCHIFNADMGGSRYAQFIRDENTRLRTIYLANGNVSIVSDSSGPVVRNGPIFVTSSHTDGSLVYLRRGGAQVNQNSRNANTANTTVALRIGLDFLGDFYGGYIVKDSNVADIFEREQFLASKAGITL